MTQMRQPKSPLNICMLSGGRGGARIARELIRQTNCSLTLLINAFDDGKSTGALRDYIPGMLGPSDVRKNLSQLAAVFSPERIALKEVLDYRFSCDANKAHAGALELVAHGRVKALPHDLKPLVSQLAPTTVTWIRSSLATFLEYETSRSQPFDWSDVALGNIVFAGLYLSHERDFNAACEALGELVAPEVRVLNVTDSDNYVLRGISSSGRPLLSEAQVIDPGNSDSVSEIFIHRDSAQEVTWPTMSATSAEPVIEWLRMRSVAPVLNPEAVAALETMDALIVAPGTPHSSIFPTLVAIRESLSTVSCQTRIMIANLSPDDDITGFDNFELASRAVSYLNSPSIADELTPITHLLIEETSDLISPRDDRITSELGIERTYARIRHPTQEFIHSAFHTTIELRSILERAQPAPALLIVLGCEIPSDIVEQYVDEILDIRWREFSTHISVIAPSKDEARTPSSSPTEETDSSLSIFYSDDPLTSARDWIAHEQRFPDDCILLLSGDGKYAISDMLLGLVALRRHRFAQLLGTRVLDREQLTESLADAYGESGVMRRLAIIGALATSLAVRIRGGIWLSDPLSGFRMITVDACRKSTRDSQFPPPITAAAAHGLNTMELPVRYYTLRGFTSPQRRIKRGIFAVSRALRNRL